MHRIHTEQLTIEERRNIWQDIFAEFEKSGFSQKKFCQEREIKLDLFVYHLGKYRRKEQKRNDTFIPVTIESSGVAHYVRLKWRELEIDFPAQVDIKELLIVIKSLGATSC